MPISVTSSYDPRPALRAGMAVRVKHAAEIDATLDTGGRLDGLPFTAEMRRYCGRVLTVHRECARVIIEQFGVRGMRDTVVLWDARCLGIAHGGCGRRCHFLWKTAWLERCDADLPPDTIVTDLDNILLPDDRDTMPPCHGQREVLMDATVPLGSAGPLRIGWYLDDVRQDYIGTGTCAAMIGTEARKFCRWFGEKVRKRLPLPERRVISRTTLPNPAPSLQPGEMVEVRPLREILPTLDAGLRVRGLHFSDAMRACCGNRYRVLARVDHLIDEFTGEMRHLKETIILDDVWCDGIIFYRCPRACYWLWREAWLMRV